MFQRRPAMKILMAAPFDVKGRYQGGISSIANSVIKSIDFLRENNLQIIKFETCRVKRSNKSEAQFNLKNIKNFLDLYCCITKAIIDSSPQVLYFHTSIRLALLKDLLVIRHAKKKTGVKTVLHIHFAEYSKIMTGRKLLDDLILFFIKKYVDKIVFLSKETLEEFSVHGLDESKSVVIYNFSTVECTPDEQKYAVENTNEKCKFLFIGSIDKRKGICDILECLAKCDSPFELHICGGYRDEETKNRVKGYISHMKSAVIEHGYVNGKEKKQLFLNSDVLVLPSYGEGLPMVIMEAYHTGCAVISTSVGAIPEIVNETNGFIIEPGNREQLLDAMNTLMNDSQLLRQMKIANIKVSKIFTLKKFIHDISDVCKEIYE